MSKIVLRAAVPDDARECLRIRGLTRENAFSEEDLAALGVTAESWAAGIEDGSCPGYVAWSMSRWLAIASVIARAARSWCWRYCPTMKAWVWAVVC